MGRFSDRVGATQPRRELQIGTMDLPLRNALWNWIRWMLDDDNAGRYNKTWAQWHAFAKSGLWDEFFHLPVDKVPEDVDRTVRAWYESAEWFDVYNLVEYVLHNANRVRGDYDKRRNVEDALNQFLERELSGYRVVQRQLVPITSAVELAEVRKAATTVSGFEGAAEHIEAALALLGKKPDPDYRNSIKESISAVEAAAKLLSGGKSGGIDTALAILERRSSLHPAFKLALSKLYAYTSDKGGIRHPILDAQTITFAEAKFMLVTCSAFVNLLIDTLRGASTSIVE